MANLFRPLQLEATVADLNDQLASERAAAAEARRAAAQLERRMAADIAAARREMEAAVEAQVRWQRC